MLHQPVHYQPGPFAQPHHHAWHASAPVDDRSAHDDSPSPARLAPSVFRRRPSDSRPPSSSGGRSTTTTTTGTPPPALSISTDYFPPSPFPTSSVAPSPSPSKPYHRSPYLSAREISSSRPSPALRPRTALPSEAATPQTPLNDRRDSWSSSTIDRVLSVGDTVGEGIDLQGEPLRALPLPSDSALEDDEEERQRPREFEVVRRLGSGSYAVVYLVREVLSRSAGERGPASDDGHVAGRLELDGEGENAGVAGVTYGREFAVKCLSKANLDEEALEAQMAEVTIHQSLPAHPNIVSLHRTFETSSFLLLLLEYVPGEDLFYFLEQARDHYDPADFPSSDDPATSSPTSQRTPPTPSLLSSLNPSQLLSRTRLRLIASMFAQMCDAVAACHDLQVFHRDIKPENFIVTDGFGPANPDTGARERKVVVKLTDFGLSTTDVDSSDMDCGSAPYMSYECRNNIAPTYKPRAADVWSLGIVLINMLYHFNPWTDAAIGVCSSFELYREQPVNFFMQRFAGMTLPVAEFLATRVFNILEGEGDDDSARISAREFGVWVKDLPQLLAAPAAPFHHHKRVISTSSIQGHPLASHPNSRPASRAASTASAAARGGTPAMHTRSLSRGGSTLPSVPASAAEYFDGPEQSTILEEEPGEGGSVEDSYLVRGEEHVLEVEEEEEVDDGASSRAQSTTKRRKRGARKGKKEQLLLQQQQQQQHYTDQHHIGMANTLDLTLDTLANASQSLVRELSRQNKMPYVAPDFAASEAESVAVSTGTQASAAVSTPSEQSQPAPPPMAKKASKWKLSFGRSSSSASPASSPVVPSPVPSVVSQSLSPVDNTAATASNVTSILMGLNAPPPTLQAQQSSPYQSQQQQQQQQYGGRSQQGNKGVKPPSPVSMFAVDDGYGRRQKPGTPAPPSIVRQQQQQQVQYPRGRQQAPSVISNSSAWSTSSERGVSPSSVRSVRGYPATSSSAASSVYSSNWRSSKVPSSAATSTSNFTRYSNGSRQSVSTIATSVSADSWRSGASKPASVAPSVASSANRARSPLGPVNDAQRRDPPRNVKVMQGIPWELHELPRQMHIKPEGDIFGKPPTSRKGGAAAGGTARTRKGKGPLEPISEQHAARAPAMRSDASTSTTDLSAIIDDSASIAPSSLVEGDNSTSADVGPKKVQKGQINALAKMLSALRR